MAGGTDCDPGTNQPSVISVNWPCIEGNNEKHFPPKRTFGDVEKDMAVLMYANSIGALQVLCPCAKRKERRDETEPLDDESLDDSDNNTLGLSAQDLRDPAAIVSLRSIPCLV